MNASIGPRLTRHRRRALALPFVVTVVTVAAGCGSDTGVAPAGDSPVTSEEVTSNPTEPAPEVTVVVSNPAEPEPEVTDVISNPAPPEEQTLVISNPAPPEG